MYVRFAVAIAVAVLGTQAYAGGAFNTGGGCYNLQLIRNTDKSQPLTDSDRHTIFLSDGHSTINLVEGPFAVLDGNATDSNGAKFQLPNPDPTGTGASAYSVYARLVGKPGSGLDITTCGVASDGTTYCSTNVLSMTRKAGTSTGQNVSKQLLTITAYIDGVLTTIPLFSDTLDSYYWDVDSYGRSHAQLRFCPVSTQLY